MCMLKINTQIEYLFYIFFVFLCMLKINTQIELDCTKKLCMYSRSKYMRVSKFQIHARMYPKNGYARRCLFIFCVPPIFFVQDPGCKKTVKIGAEKKTKKSKKNS